MNQPTNEQIQWFWEQCGFRYIEPEYCASCRRREPPYILKEGIGRRIGWNELTVDLNNLFKYAVPGVNWWSINQGVGSKVFAEVRKYSEDGGSFQRGIYENEDPALALFWAIYKAFGGK